MFGKLSRMIIKCSGGMIKLTLKFKGLMHGDGRYEDFENLIFRNPEVQTTLAIDRFRKYQSFACNWHPTEAFLPVEITPLIFSTCLCVNLCPFLHFGIPDQKCLVRVIEVQPF